VVFGVCFVLVEDFAVGGVEFGGGGECLVGGEVRIVAREAGGAWSLFGAGVLATTSGKLKVRGDVQLEP
jgi:hypothetical protein